MAQTPAQKPFTEQLALKEISPNVYETINQPQRMGNPLNIAYGGYALGVACKAAGLSVPAGYHMYSMLGTYLGPAYTEQQLIAKVRVIRQTRTFATRQVEVVQRKEGEAQERVCLIAIADFQVREKGSLLEYSKTPANQYPKWQECKTQEETFKQLLDDGKISKKLLDAQADNFKVLPNLFEQRSIPSAIFAQNLFGVAKKLPHTQDHLAPADRTTADWFRCRESLPSAVEHATNLAFIIDGAISFTPLSFNHMWFDDVAAVSSLEFALRIFQNGKEDGIEGGLDMNQWHLREISARVAGEGRSYGESWVWDEQGRAVACMTQQSILRPKPQGKGKVKL